MITLPFILLVFLTLVSLAAVFCHVTLIPFLRMTKDFAPELRSHLLVLMALAPWLLGSGVLLSSIADVVFGACDMYSSCLWDGDTERMTLSRALVTFPLALATLVLILQALRHIIVSRRIIASIDSVSIQEGNDTLEIVPSDTAFAFAGFKKIYVSRALRERLSPEQYQAVILHEQAHLTRHDGFYQAAAAVVTSCYIPPFRRMLLNALALANEEACDQRAAAGVGRQTTAAAILAVARIRNTQIRALLPGFADGFVADRVRVLLAPEPDRTRVGFVRLVALSTIVGVLPLADVLYYLCLSIL